MSLGRLIKKIKERPEDEVSLEKVIHEYVLNPPKFKTGKALRTTDKLLAALEAGDIKGARDIFVILYGLMANAQPRAEHVFHPSTVEGDCARMLYFDINKVPKTDVKRRVIKPSTYITFDQGTWFHLYAQYILWQAGVLDVYEAHIKDDKLCIEGYTDGILKGPKKRILEIKTMNSYTFKSAQYGPLDKHKKQPSIYASVKGIDEIHYLYFNKDNSEMIEWIYKVEPPLIEPILNKMKMIREAKSPPPRVCSDASCPTAMECQWRTHCFKLKK